MHRIVLVLLLTIMSSSASAGCAQDKYDLSKKASDEMGDLIKYLESNPSFRKLLDEANSSSCDVQLKIVEENYNGSIKMKTYLLATTSETCKEGEQLTEARYRLAEQNGSYAAANWFKGKKTAELEAELERFTQTKPYPPKIGMNRNEVYGSTFGKPNNQETLTTIDGVTIIWTYKWGGSVVFDGCGKLAVIHER